MTGAVMIGAAPVHMEVTFRYLQEPLYPQTVVLLPNPDLSSLTVTDLRVGSGL